MTVCIALAFRWICGPADIGWAVLTASDQMLTAGDVEYEPPQMKQAQFGPQAVVLVAGQMAVHSDLIRTTQRKLLHEPEHGVREVAETYAEALRSYRAKRAAELHLSPLGLDAESLIERQASMDPALVRDLERRLHGYHTDVEAIVAGALPRG